VNRLYGFTVEAHLQSKAANAILAGIPILPVKLSKDTLNLKENARASLFQYKMSLKD
jgi:hypothetical protein